MFVCSEQDKLLECLAFFSFASLLKVKQLIAKRFTISLDILNHIQMQSKLLCNNNNGLSGEYCHESSLCFTSACNTSNSYVSCHPLDFRMKMFLSVHTCMHACVHDIEEL